MPVYRVSDARGECEEVYTTADGMDPVPDGDPYEGPAEGTRGWLQINPRQRVEVIRNRVGHSACRWQRLYQ